MTSTSGCWTQTNDVHGFGGVAHNFTTVEQCQSACVDDKTCVAVDWEPSNAAKSCWIQTWAVVGPTSTPGIITHYELNRAFLSQYTFCCTRLTFSLYHTLLIMPPIEDVEALSDAAICSSVCLSVCPYSVCPSVPCLHGKSDAF